MIQAAGRSKAPKLLTERYMLQQDVLFFPQRHFLFEVFDRKIQQLSEAGLIDYYVEKVNEGWNPKKLEQHKKPFKVLTLGELEAGFMVSIAPLALSLLVFCIEWIVAMKDLLVFHFTFEAYFTLKKCEQDRQSELKKIKLFVTLNDRVLSLKQPSYFKQIFKLPKK